MTISLKTKAAGNANLDLVFDPYVEGTHPADTGLLADASLGGADIAVRYAPIIYGSLAAPTGLLTKQTGHADINTLFAAYGTAVYSLPINGNTYTESVNIVSGSASSTIGFRIIGGATWQVYGTNSLGGSTSFATGSIPSGAVTVKYTWGTYTIAVGFTDAGGSTFNGASTATAISSNPIAYYTTNNNTSTSGSKQRNYPFTIDFYNASAANISHTVCNLIGETEGSI